MKHYIKTKKYLFSILWIGYLITSTFFLQSCKEESHQPLVGGIKPESLKNVQIENRNGVALVTYSLPDEGAFYVLAEYEPKPGVKREAKSSIYKQELFLDGFYKEQEYEVNLYVVGKDEQRSEPLKISVSPLAPPYMSTFNTIQVLADWGGLTINASNVGENDFMFSVFEVGEDGKPKEENTYYTKQKDVQFSVRGYESKDTQFGIYVRDKFENRSDTLYLNLKPLFEKEIDRTKFLEVRLPTDTYQSHNLINTPMHRMWNDDITNRDNLFLTLPNASPIPQWFTFDMSKKVKLSRMRIWHRNTFFFEGGNLKRFELYGSNNPAADGSWESWNLIGSFESKKPSGLPRGQLSNEDNEYIRAGEEFVFGLDNQPYRYLRLKTLEVWGGVQYISIQMMKVWGEEVE